MVFLCYTNVHIIIITAAYCSHKNGTCIFSYPTALRVARVRELSMSLAEQVMVEVTVLLFGLRLIRCLPLTMVMGAAMLRIIILCME